jgi:hypothetical protein
MCDDEIEAYEEMIEPERRRRVNTEAVWQMYLGAFLSMQEMRARLAISLLRETDASRRGEVQKVVDRIDRLQARVSMQLMDLDFERWQEIIKPDHEEWAANVALLRKRGEEGLASEMGGLLMTMRVLVNTERCL